LKIEESNRVEKASQRKAVRGEASVKITDALLQMLVDMKAAPGK